MQKKQTLFSKKIYLNPDWVIFLLLSLAALALILMLFSSFQKSAELNNKLYQKNMSKEIELQSHKTTLSNHFLKFSSA